MKIIYCTYFRGKVVSNTVRLVSILCPVVGTNEGMHCTNMQSKDELPLVIFLIF